jgi:hypothetical protein
MMTEYLPIRLPENAPARLTITLWDFSWYVRSGPGEPFADLDRSVRQAVERGYNTLRICAMPFLLFGSGLDTGAMTFAALGDGYADQVRWYDVGASTTIDARAHLLALFEACRRSDVFVILSSWEYQQSASFAVEPAWWDALCAVEPDDRPIRLAESLSQLIDFLAIHGLDDRVVFTELHNEVQGGHLTDGLTMAGVEDSTLMSELEPRLSRGIARFHELQPDRPVTVNYAAVPVGGFRAVPAEIDVFVVHPYVYGVLDETIAASRMLGPLEDYPDDATEAKSLLRVGAPPASRWRLPEIDAWKYEASIIPLMIYYFFNWVDPARFDRYLYERYESHRFEMARVLKIWFEAAADLSIGRGIPLVFGEGWIGYTPLHSEFEGGPVGADFCRMAMIESRRVGAYGSIVCSNAAPHHPMWADVPLQLECNALFLGHSIGATS